MCSFGIVSYLAENNVSFTENKGQIVKMYEDIHIKCLLYLSGFGENRNALTYFKKSPKHVIVQKPGRWDSRC